MSIISDSGFAVYISTIVMYYNLLHVESSNFHDSTWINYSRDQVYFRQVYGVLAIVNKQCAILGFPWHR